MTHETLTLFALDGESAPRRTPRQTRAPRKRTPTTPFPYPESPTEEAAKRNFTNDAIELRLLLTPVEAARALGISRSKLYELLGDGSIESVLIGASRRVPAEALEDYVASLPRSRTASISTDL